MIERHNYLKNFENAVLEEAELFGETYLDALVLPDFKYLTCPPELGYETVRKKTKELIEIYQKQLDVLEEKQRRITLEFKQFQRNLRRHVNRSQLQSIPVRNLDLSELEQIETLQNLKKSMMFEHSLPDCTNAIQYWLVWMKENKQFLPTIEKIQMCSLLQDSRDLLTVVFKHPNYETPFRGLVTVGVIYYVYGHVGLKLIMRQAYLSYATMKKYKPKKH